MSFVRQFKFILIFFALLIFCAVMVVRQYNLKQDKHVEMREAFILLHTRNETNDARRLFDKLVLEIPQWQKKLSDRQLLDDFQRTLVLVDPYSQQTNSLLWRYHWTLSDELNRRAESSLERARKLAREK